LGAGATGIPFTDTKRLESDCAESKTPDIATHEPSSVFVYEMIKAYGGPKNFYGNDFYISSVSPLGFVMRDTKTKRSITTTTTVLRLRKAVNSICSSDAWKNNSNSIFAATLFLF
jgi:hypothetical protein